VIRTALIVAWCGVLAVQSQQPPRDTPPPTAAPSAASISGTVTSDEAHPRKLRRVLVTLNGAGLAEGGRTVISDDEGRFRFDALPAGQYGLMATKAGYVSARYGTSRVPRYFNYLSLPRAGVSIRAGENATADIRLVPGAVITGVVTDTEGRPEQGVLVSASSYRLIGGDGERRLVPAAGRATDDRGAYRIFGLPAGEYVVVAEGPPGVGQPGIRLSSTDSPSLPAAPMYFPSTTDSSAATRIQLGAGEERDGIDIQIRYVPMATVSGVATIPPGSTSGRVWLTRAGGGASGQPEATNVVAELSLAPDGAFTFPGIAPGGYLLHATARGGLPGGPMDVMLAAGSVSVHVAGEDVSNVMVPMQPTFSVSGTLLFDGPHRPSAQVGSMTLPIAPVGGYTIPTVSFQASDESHFTISGLMTGAYRPMNATNRGFETPMMGQWWLKSFVIAGREALDQPFDTFQPGDDVVVTVSDRASAVSGVVHDTHGLPVPGVFVTIFGADRASWFLGSRRVATVHTDAQGRYTIRNLPPGDYRAAVSLDLEPGELFDGLLQTLLPNAVPLTISSVEARTLDLILR
jgi:hypothetical protein